MDIFDLMQDYGHEQVVFCHDEESGLKSIIAIHDTTLGPALGGTRMWPYRSTQEALIDVLRLSEGMTYKAAVAGLELGGGKSVILGDPKTDKTEALLRAHGRFVDTLGGRYITAEDVGISVDDMEYVYQATRHVTGIRSSPRGSGDPSPVTAYGVYWGIKASCRQKLGSDDLSGVRIAVQGAGHVGYHLCEDLAAEGAVISITDIDQERVNRVVEEFGATPIAPDDIYDVDCEVFAPCALGAVINDQTLRRLRCRVVAGAANNQLAEDRHGDAVDARGILYAPDYVINAGGLISVYSEIVGYDAETAKEKARGIYETLLKVYRIAEEDAIPTYRAAERLARHRLRKARLQRAGTGQPEPAAAPATT
ncbi:MAG TPA: Glu/Leu/Phe/Val dehydrogenase dimerization domain-containing protein [Gemmatimonadota bacterium]|nr:Glu/Leu/Phe/Val dehydrogenase dimerization domain-containing protein [Gemmatimonadota bacterium]